MKTKVELKKAHGTPAEFARAVWRSYGQGWLTADEARAAIRKYELEWTMAK